MTEIKLEIKEEQRELYEKLLGIVHCKDCKWYIPVNGIYGKCTYRMREHVINWPSDYCSYGERKEQENE